MVFARVCASAVLCVGLAVPVTAQTASTRAARPGDAGPNDFAVLARAWTLVSQGSYPAAAALAQEVLRKDPRSVNALAVAVEAAVGQQGATAGLDQYEHWLGSRALEEPGVLRRISRAVLQEAARNSTTRLAALRDLASDGDADAASELADAARRGGGAEQRAMARLGDRDAAKALSAQLDGSNPDPVRMIEAVGDSGYAPAFNAVAAWLGDQRPEVRGAAADALGKLGEQSPNAVKLLTPLLSDQSSHVRTRAAAALYRLGDPAGTPWLQELSASEVPAGRLVAAEAMSSRPDAAWTALVTELATTGTDPEIRLGAAKLIGPHNPELANSIARELSSHDNLAIREIAIGLASDTTSGDNLAALRALLRTGDDATRLRAATRILALTR